MKSFTDSSNSKEQRPPREVDSAYTQLVKELPAVPASASQGTPRRTYLS
jgi:hypothetical protein